MSFHPTVLHATNLIQSLVATIVDGPMTEQKREDCRAAHRAMLAALNTALDHWCNGDLSDQDKEVLVTASRMLADVKELVQLACNEMRRQFD